MTDQQRGFVRGSGVPHRGPAAVWADCIDTPCPNCHVDAGSYCLLQANTKTFPKHAPCLSRIRAAEKGSA